MTVQLHPAYAGDAIDERVVKLAGVTTLATATSVRATVRHQSDSSQPVGVLSAEVTDAPANEVTISLGTWLSDGPAPAVWDVQVEVTFSDSSVWTWPRPDRPCTIMVAADHD